ncbi:MAG: winged helix-turn-helix transcriptional regulator [Silicimonas sp.]|nr:winged helix-turn-helix transcriptional regulator [Silicimonas sp.]
MEQIGYEVDPGTLDAVFSALADPTRRAILQRLTKGGATVGEIAKPFEISQPAISRHLRVLENAGLVERGADRQTRPARLTAQPMKDAVAWLEDFRAHWEGRLDQLDQLLPELQPKDIP